MSKLISSSVVEGRGAGHAPHYLWRHGHWREGTLTLKCLFVALPSAKLNHFHQEGIIEAVLNSTTVAEIAKEAGGATAVFNTQTIANWLKQQNPAGKFLC